MRLGGLQKMTLLDFPGRVACTVFTLGCNFRCPFCHNAPLVGAIHESTEAECGQLSEADPSTAARSPSPAGRGGFPEYSLEEFFKFLEKRQGLLDGVAITGGEPLLHRDSDEFLRRIRALGYAVKLDTNGAFPERLQAILEEGLVDYVAVDIKNSKEKYALTVGLEERISPLASLGRNDIPEKVDQTVRLLKESAVDYEFRTTLVDELHEPEDFEKIGRWIEGAPRYFIQQFVDSGAILGGENVFHAASKEKTEACLEAVKRFVPAAELRGQ